MEIKKITPLTITQDNEQTTAAKAETPRMFKSEFPQDEGIQVEKTQQNQQEGQKTYQKTTKDDNGNDLILTYRTRDNALLYRETKFSFGYTLKEFIKPGTNIIEKSQEFNTDNRLIKEDIYNESAPFGIKISRDFDKTDGEITAESFYENGSEKPVRKKMYEPNKTIEMRLLDGEPEEITVYRKDGSIAEHTEPIQHNGEKHYLNTIYRQDGTIYSQGIFADSYASFVIENKKYTYDGTTVDSKEYLGNDNKIHNERYSMNGQARVKEIYNANGSRLLERTIFDKEGQIFIQTQYDSEGRITNYIKNDKSSSCSGFQEKLLNGEIDTSFKQGYAGTCYIASTIKGLLETEQGKKILDDAMDYDSTTQTSTIRLKGKNKNYTFNFTKNEIEKAMDRLGTGDPDFTAFLLGYEQYRIEERHSPVDGGLGTEVMYSLTGNEGESNILFGTLVNPITDDTLDYLQNKLQTTPTVITAGTPGENVDTEFSQEDKEKGLANSHSYTITQITSDSVHILEPVHDRKIVLSRKEFMEKFVSYNADDIGNN